ncbi:MAG: hypothetical protein NSGCLCUN01_03949 [uncultured Clostridium sp.]
MKVKELIANLEKENQENDICIVTQDGTDTFDISDIFEGLDSRGNIGKTCTVIEVEEERNNNVIYDEPKEDEDKVQRAIIVLGDEKIEIEVDNYDIDDNIVEIESVDGRVFITDIKNVLLMSE